MTKQNLFPTHFEANYLAVMYLFYSKNDMIDYIENEKMFVYIGHFDHQGEYWYLFMKTKFSMN